MKKIKELLLTNNADLKTKILNATKQFKHSAILVSNGYNDKYGTYEYLAAVGSARLLSTNDSCFENLQKFHDEKPTWLFGHISYDTKNQLEKLSSKNPKRIGFSQLSFFEPLYLFIQKHQSNKLEVWIHKEAKEKDLQTILAENKEYLSTSVTSLPQFLARQSKKQYIETIDNLKKEIQQGNIYEINYCTEFYAENASIKPTEVFESLNQLSPMPFSSFYKEEDRFAICASPERFIAKHERTIISQPIKGTSKRGKNIDEDKNIKINLKNDLKEQTENVMIVDLVRNDLSKIAKKSSVRVEELFGVYSFPQVHQLISTVSCELSEKYFFSDVIKATFPMGSMTGAPKISAMLLADRYEKSRRELYSGTLGYITPDGDFDFNVVIRSLCYSANKNYLSLIVGGAITDLANPEKEYEECLLKAKAIFELNSWK